MHSYVVVTWLGSASEAAVAVINHVTRWSVCQCGRETGKFWVFRLLSARVGSALLSALGNRFGTRKSSCFVSAWLGGRYWSLLRSALSSHFWRPAWSLVSTSPVNFFFYHLGPVGLGEASVSSAHVNWRECASPRGACAFQLKQTHITKVLINVTDDFSSLTFTLIN